MLLNISKFNDSTISCSEQIRLPNQSQAEVAVAEFPYSPAHWITCSLFRRARHHAPLCCLKLAIFCIKHCFRPLSMSSQFYSRLCVLVCCWYVWPVKCSTTIRGGQGSVLNDSLRVKIRYFRCNITHSFLARLLLNLLEWVVAKLNGSVVNSIPDS